jgi:hypothetical protein
MFYLQLLFDTQKGMSRGTPLKFRWAVAKHDLELLWQQRLVWKLIPLIPKTFIYWGVVGAACRAAGGGNPSTVTIVQIMEELEKGKK